MRPLLQRRAAARLAAALLTPFLPELRQQPALAISATTMSGKTRPDTGCVLVSEPRIDKVGKAQILNAELVTSDGYVVTASFETPWFLQLGNYYDVEVRSKEGTDGAFLVSKTPPQGTSSSASWFSDNIFGISGRYGAYGAPQDVRVLRDERDRSVDGGRLLEYSFTALKGNAEVQRRAFVKAMSPPGSRDVVILVAGTTARAPGSFFPFDSHGPAMACWGERRHLHAIDATCSTHRPADGKRKTARKPRGPSSTRCACLPRKQI